MQTISKNNVLEAVYSLKLVLANENQWELSFFDAREANERHRLYREIVQEKIAQYRTWRDRFQSQQHNAGRDIRVIMADSVDGRFLMAQIDLAFSSYREVSADAIKTYNRYIKQCRKR